MRGLKEKRNWPAERPMIPQNTSINDRLIIRMRDLNHIMRSLYEGKGSQKHVLIVLEEIGGRITQRELTQRLGIQPGSASEVIVKLEHAGYIARTPSEIDRRTADITLTEAGKARAAEAKAQRVHRHEEMFSCLSEGEKEELLGLLNKIHADWASRYQGVDRSDRGQGSRRAHRCREDKRRTKEE
ncbi:MAG TPA: MarR family transcriptional regulator [Firmicutes bacterium]|nr:MarR family transcriptional regulator [Bacillota bacterium]